MIFAALCWSLSLLGPPFFFHVNFWSLDSFLNPALRFSFCTSETVGLSFRVLCGVVIIRFYINLKSINRFPVPHDVSLQSENVLIEVETVLMMLHLETKSNFFLRIFPKAVGVNVGFFMYLY